MVLSDRAEYQPPLPRLHSVPLWDRASQVWLALPIGFAPRPTIIWYNCFMVLIDFLGSRYLHGAKFFVFEYVEVVFSLQR